MATRFNEFWTNAKNTIINWLSDPSDPQARILAARGYEQNLALQYYDGRPPKPLKVDARTQVDDNLFVNYAEMIVDKGVSFLFGDGLAIDIDDEGAERALEELWPAETRAEDFHDLGTDGGIFGDAWVKILIGPDGKPSPIVLDPSIWYKITDPDNYKKIDVYRCQYPRPNGRIFREETRFDQGRRKWVSQTFESANGGKSFYAIGPEVLWNFSFPPILVAKNLPQSKSPYGRPDLSRSVLELCRYLSRTDSLIGKITRVHSSPKSIAKGLAAQDLQIGVDSTIFMKNPEASLELLEMKGDLAGAMAFRKLLREALSEISKIPEIATGKLENVGQLSGRAMQILYGPLLKQTATKRRFYGPLITETVRGLLEANGYSKAAEVKIEVQWPSAVPADPREEGEIALIWKELGVSTETIHDRLGFDAEAEAKKRGAEDEAAAEKSAAKFNSGFASGELYQ